MDKARSGNKFMKSPGKAKWEAGTFRKKVWEVTLKKAIQGFLKKTSDRKPAGNLRQLTRKKEGTALNGLPAKLQNSTKVEKRQ